MLGERQARARAGYPWREREAPAEDVTSLIDEVRPRHRRAARRFVQELREESLLRELPVVLANRVPVWRATKDIVARGGGQHHVLAEQPVRERFGGDEPAQTETVECSLELFVGDNAEARGILAGWHACRPFRAPAIGRAVN